MDTLKNITQSSINTEHKKLLERGYKPFYLKVFVTLDDQLLFIFSYDAHDYDLEKLKERFIEHFGEFLYANVVCNFSIAYSHKNFTYEYLTVDVLNYSYLDKAFSEVLPKLLNIQLSTN